MNHLDDPGGDAIERCSNFISDIIDVCRKHRVLIQVDEAYGGNEAEFEEQTNCPSGIAPSIVSPSLFNTAR